MTPVTRELATRIVRGFYPGWEFQEILVEDRNSTLFDLVAEPMLVVDEPGTLDGAAKQYREKVAAAHEGADHSSPATIVGR